ncbi:MAG: SDR family oxidoreductase [bacterium]|nr:SDR family oxidoreductase [bacterium]
MGILDLSGRGALVVGGGQGMGRATALLLAQAGANPAVVDAERERAENVAAEIEALGRKSAALSADVTKREEVEGLIAAADQAVGPLDIVVNIVGGATWAPLLSVDDAHWDRNFDVNLRHHLYVSQTAARNWVDQERPGVLCIVASVSGMFGAARHGAYGAAKAGVLSFVKTAAEEWWPHGIRVNCVVPGTVRTPRMEAEWASGKTPQPSTDLLGTIAEPEDIGGAITFLVSDLARKITGQALVVDGGWTTRFPYSLT